MRPWDSVSGTRCTRCVPPSNLKTEYAPSPLTSKVTSLKPPASERKAQVGSGERSEKIRTYNFPQGRVTDHRIKHTSHNLDGVLAGQLGEFTDALSAEEKRQRLEAAASAA